MSPNSDLIDPTLRYLELSPEIMTAAWQHSQIGATPASRWNMYVNQMGLAVVLSWLRDENIPSAKVYPHTAALSSIWEVVNGTAITLQNTRLVMIPSEAIDLSELRVPQEWVDIPSWVADYYVAVKVNPDDGYVRLWGYCTHQRLKTIGQYYANDRTYSIAAEDLISDLGALWVVQQLNSAEPTRSPVEPLPPLSLQQSNHLLQQLGNPQVHHPRLSVPFQAWGALLEHGGWRQRLAQLRRGQPEQRSVLQWLQTAIDNVAQQSGWEQIAFQPRFAIARGNEATTPTTALARQLTIADQPYELLVLPVDNEETGVWRFELRSLSPSGQIPAGFRLRLLTEDLQPFEGNEDSAVADVESLYVELMLEPGEGIVWEIEPAPEHYDREILRF